MHVGVQYGTCYQNLLPRRHLHSVSGSSRPDDPNRPRSSCVSRADSTTSAALNLRIRHPPQSLARRWLRPPSSNTVLCDLSRLQRLSTHWQLATQSHVPRQSHRGCTALRNSVYHRCPYPFPADHFDPPILCQFANLPRR